MATLVRNGQSSGGKPTRAPARPDTGAEPADPELVRLAVDGSREAFELLYRRHAAAAWRVAQAVTRKPEDAADAVAEAFARVFQTLPKRRLGPDLAFRPYLLAAVRNAAIDGLRKSGRLRPTEEMERFVEHVPGPSEKLVVGDDRLKMAEAFAALPERWRSVLWMTEVEEMPARDVGKLLGLSANAVAQLAVRARAGLRDRYLQAHVRNHARPDCAHTADHLGAYVGGGLAPRDVAKVDQHLAGCTDCQARLTEVEDISFTLRRIALPVPLGLAGLALKRFRLGVARAARHLVPAADGARRAVGVAAGVGAIVIGFGGLAFVGPAPAPTATADTSVELAAASAAPTPGASAPGGTTATPTVAPRARSSTPLATPALPVSVPPLRAVHVPLPPAPVPVETRAGAPGIAVTVGDCTGATVGPVTAGCAPSAPSAGAHVEVPGVLGLRTR
jgi:RNA polymerase sigma factor (sigma-70 family)